LEKDEVYKRVRAKVEKLLGFYFHLAVYVVVNGFLLTINLTAYADPGFAPGYLWAKWPLMGWGIGLFFHAFRLFGSGYKERMIEKMIKKEMGQQ
jgi:hypothetical protein